MTAAHRPVLTSLALNSFDQTDYDGNIVGVVVN